MEYLKLYNLEEYLCEVVRDRFLREKRLSAFDFFCIIIWKANRAKSKVAAKLLGQGADLDDVVSKLTSDLAYARSDKERGWTLLDKWEFGLPIASVILTILWPENFTVYDYRVCEQLGRHQNVKNKASFDDKWLGYLAYVEDVRKGDG